MAPSDNVKYKVDLGSIVHNREPSNHLKNNNSNIKRELKKKEERERVKKRKEGGKEDDRTNDVLFLHFISSGQII